MSKTLLGSYRNGNYNCFIYNDGTKVRINNEDKFIPEFPESIDMKISNRCNMGCPFCHERSTPNGDLANLNHPLLDSIRSSVEIALGGGNILEHPDLNNFLFRMQRQKVICNATFHLQHFTNNYDYIKELVDKKLIYGIGISVNSTITDSQIELIKSIPNVVVHVIAGVVPWETLVKMANHGIKLLILGYKTFGRGEVYQENHQEVKENIKQLQERLPYLMKHYPVISFDNLAIKQLNIKELVDEETWNKTYMGDDGQFTMYVDLVKEEYAVSSISSRKPIGAETDISNLFKNIGDSNVL